MDEDQRAALTAQEIMDFIDTILEGVENVEEGMGFRPTWVYEMRDWCALLLTRLHEGGSIT